MSDDENSDGAHPSSPAKRVVTATRYRAGAKFGKVEIQASTKHGPTALISLGSADVLDAGETLVTDGYVFGARNFVVVGEHKKPMKIAGIWYEVRPTQTTPPAKAVVKSNTKSKK